VSGAICQWHHTLRNQISGIPKPYNQQNLSSLFFEPFFQIYNQMRVRNFLYPLVLRLDGYMSQTYRIDCMWVSNGQLASTLCHFFSCLYDFSLSTMDLGWLLWDQLLSDTANCRNRLRYLDIIAAPRSTLCDGNPRSRHVKSIHVKELYNYVKASDDSRLIPRLEWGYWTHWKSQV